MLTSTPFFWSLPHLVSSSLANLLGSAFKTSECSSFFSHCLVYTTILSHLVACCWQAASVMSDSVRLHGLQPTRLLCSWDSPGKNTGVGCHFLLQCMKVESESEVAQSCLTLRDPMDCSLPGSSAHGIFQARVLEWVTSAFSIYIYIHVYIYTHTLYRCPLFSR